MAEGFANKLGLRAISAGTVPSTHVNPLVVQVMQEKGVDITLNKTKEITPEMVDCARLVVLIDASLKQSLDKNLAKKVKKKLVEWNLPDPQGKSIEEIRFIRDQIERMVRSLASTTGSLN